MVQSRSRLPQDNQLDSQAIEQWLNGLQESRSADEMAYLRKAAAMAVEIHQGSLQEDGESTLRHALSVAEILVDMDLDWETLVAAILHDVSPDGAIDSDRLSESFSPGVALMVRDMSRIGSLTRVQSDLQQKRVSEHEHLENLRRMLLSVAQDIRVLLIVLAERLHLMRMLRHLPEEVRRKLAVETQEIYAPLANRLGIWQLKWELEDLGFRYTNPETYKELAKQLGARRSDREDYIQRVIETLQEQFAAVGLKAEISGRPKHIYSIWRKMKRKGVGLDQIFDLRAVRVLVESIADCYAALGVVHGLWRHIPGEFDDYIATPKANLYRSIHTAVIGPEEKPLEVQIRTREMHQHAELGVAAHWRYKEGGGKEDPEFQRRVSLMRNWLESKEDLHQEPAESAQLEDEVDLGRVYVLTPQGKVVELPKGSTAVDFAYAIHSSIGHRCRGVRIDGRIAQLTQPLESGQTVEVLTVKEGGPSRDWLSHHLGYLHTSKARNRIRQWFKQQDYDSHLHAGRQALDREVSRLGLPKLNLEKLAEHFNLTRADDLLAAVGRGDLSPVQVAGVVGREQMRRQEQEVPPKLKSKTESSSGRSKRAGQVVVEGVDDLMTHMARCCKPVPGDEIIGFITRGRGVTVHRYDCPVVAGFSDEERDRLVDVAWVDDQEEGRYPVDVRLISGDRKGLLRDVSAVLSNEEVDVLGINTQSSRSRDQAIMRITLEIASMRQLSRVLDKLAQLPDVIDVRRVV